VVPMGLPVDVTNFDEYLTMLTSSGNTAAQWQVDYTYFS